MRVCCVPGCNNRYVPNGIIGFHHLPQGVRNEERRKLWEKNIGRTLSPKSIVCDRHFTQDQFELNRQDGKKPLKWNAIPTIFSLRKLLGKKSEDPLQVSVISAPQILPITFIPPAVEEILQIEEKPPQVTKLAQKVMIPIDKKKLQEIKKDTPPGCIPILPKDTPLYVSVKKTEIDDYKTEALKYKFLAESYANKINKLKLNRKNLPKMLMMKKKLDLKHVFNDDQLECLSSLNCDSNQINWGYKTIDKAVELYKTCGENGYRVILDQKLPYPSIELLRKLRPEISTKIAST